jgi:hypothetical protein
MIKVRVERDIARINRVLAQIPQQMQFAAFDKALPAAGRVVAQRAKELAPRSATNEKGGREKMSAKAKATWSAEPLADMIEVKPLKATKQNDPYVLVGPKFPEGNKANFIHPMKSTKKEQVLWGRRVGPVNKDNDFLKRAADETKPAQLRAFLKALIPDVRRRLKSLGR